MDSYKVQQLSHLENLQHAICLIRHEHKFALAHLKQLQGSGKSSGMWFPLIIQGIKCSRGFCTQEDSI